MQEIAANIAVKTSFPQEYIDAIIAAASIYDGVIANTVPELVKLYEMSQQLFPTAAAFNDPIVKNCFRGYVLVGFGATCKNVLAIHTALPCSHITADSGGNEYTRHLYTYYHEKSDALHGRVMRHLDRHYLAVAAIVGRASSVRSSSPPSATTSSLTTAVEPPPKRVKIDTITAATTVGLSRPPLFALLPAATQLTHRSRTSTDSFAPHSSTSLTNPEKLVAKIKQAIVKQNNEPSHCDEQLIDLSADKYGVSVFDVAPNKGCNVTMSATTASAAEAASARSQIATNTNKSIQLTACKIRRIICVLKCCGILTQIELNAVAKHFADSNYIVFIAPVWFEYGVYMLQINTIPVHNVSTRAVWSTYIEKALEFDATSAENVPIVAEKIAAAVPPAPTPTPTIATDIRLPPGMKVRGNFDMTKLKWDIVSATPHDNVLELLRVNPHKIHWPTLLLNPHPKAREIVREHPDKINYAAISALDFLANESCNL